MYRIAEEMSPDDLDWNIHESRRYESIKVHGTEVWFGHGDDGPRDPSDLEQVSGAEDVLVLHGHSHESELRGKLESRALVVQNGCLVGSTELDETALARRVTPSQRAMFIHPEHGPIEGPTIRPA